MTARPGNVPPRLEIQKKLRDGSARSSTLAFLAITVLGMGLETALARTLGIPIWPSIASLILAILLLASLLGRPKIGRQISSTLFFVGAMAAIAAFLYTNPFYAALGDRWIPFQGSKLACLIAAMLAPTYWAGGTVILLTVGFVILQFSTFPIEVRLGLAAGEPWVMIGFGIAGALILWNRLHRLELERNSIVARMEFAAAQDIARLTLQLRDCLNTPLQTLELSIELLRKRDPANEKIALHMKQALELLKATNETLAQHEHEFAWRSEDIAFNSR